MTRGDADRVSEAPGPEGRAASRVRVVTGGFTWQTVNIYRAVVHTRVCLCGLQLHCADVVMFNVMCRLRRNTQKTAAAQSQLCTCVCVRRGKTSMRAGLTDVNYYIMFNMLQLIIHKPLKWETCFLLTMFICLHQCPACNQPVRTTFISIITAFISPPRQNYTIHSSGRTMLLERGAFTAWRNVCTWGVLHLLIGVFTKEKSRLCVLKTRDRLNSPVGGFHPALLNYSAVFLKAQRWRTVRLILWGPLQGCYDAHIVFFSLEKSLDCSFELLSRLWTTNYLCSCRRRTSGSSHKD